MDNLEKKSFLIKLNSIATDVPHTVIAFNYINEYYKSLTDIEKDEFYDWAFEISHFIPKLCIKAKISKTHFKANVGSMDCEQTWEIPTPPNFEFKEHIKGRTYYFFKYWIERRTNKIEWVNNWLEEAKEEAQKKTDEETINIEKDLEFIPKSEQQAHLISLQKEWFRKFKTIKYNPEEKDFFYPEHWEIPEFEHSECTLPSTCYVIGSMFYYHYLGVLNWLREKVEQSNDIQPQQNETLPNVVQIFEAQAKDIEPQYIINESPTLPIKTFKLKEGVTDATVKKYFDALINNKSIDCSIEEFKTVFSDEDKLPDNWKPIRWLRVSEKKKKGTPHRTGLAAIIIELLDVKQSKLGIITMSRFFVDKNGKNIEPTLKSSKSNREKELPYIK